MAYRGRKRHYYKCRNIKILRNMEIINVKVEKETREQLERLVQKKAYNNISEAVRQIIKDHLKEHPELFAHGIDLERLIGEANKMSDLEFEKLTAEVFKQGKKKSAAEIVRESRGGS
jgi:Arc/MetJ-type ribon-helix-helix transcriptional regulator